jgi:integrase
VIVPTLGSVPLDNLTTRHVDEWLRLWSDRSPATVKRYHAVLRAALNLAVKWELLSDNPANRASLPKLEEDELKVPTRAEVGSLIDAMPNEVLKVAVRLAVLSGARRGELCALRWPDITGDALTIARSAYRSNGETFEKRPKSGRARTIVLGPELRDTLTVWKLWCIERAKGFGVELSPDAFVLSTWPDGSQPLNPDTLTSHVSRAAKDLGIGHVHLHSLRHGAATAMLSAGVGIRDVAAALGHADGGKLALSRYGHGTDEGKMAASAAMALALPKERNQDER